MNNLFHAVYHLCTQAHAGAFLPQVAATLLAARTGQPAERFCQFFQQPYVQLYPDVRPLFDQLFCLHRQIPILWTQGEVRTTGGDGYQAHKFYASGLPARYPQWWVRSQSLGLSPIYGGLDKQAALADLLAHLPTSAPRHLLLVDDNLAQLQAAEVQLHALPSYTYTLYHLKRNSQPTHLAANLHRINSLLQVLDHCQTANHLILFDLDYTLIDHQVTRQHSAAQVAALLNQPIGV